MSRLETLSAGSLAFGRVLTKNLPLLATGYRNTVVLVALAFAGSLVLGTLVAVVRLAPLPFLPGIARAEVEIIRNTPLVVQMSFLLIGLGSTGIRLSAFAAAGIGLTVYTGAYVTEVVRSGISAVGPGQMDAARSIGMTFGQTMRLVLLPQAIRTVIPPLGNLMIAMVKNSAIASAIAYPELLYQSDLLDSRTFATVELFAGTLIGFLSLTIPLSFAIARLEQRLRVAS